MNFFAAQNEDLVYVRIANHFLCQQSIVRFEAELFIQFIFSFQGAFSVKQHLLHLTSGLSIPVLKRPKDRVLKVFLVGRCTYDEASGDQKHQKNCRLHFSEV